MDKKTKEMSETVNCIYQQGVDFNALSQETADLVAQSFLPNMQIIPFERPDVIFFNDSVCVGVECFDFDSSKSKKKTGSLSKLNQVKNEKESESKTPINGSYSSTFKTETNKDSYLSNFVQSFKQHSGKIVDYRKNLLEKCPHRDDYILVFFVNDSSALPNFQMTAKGPRPVWVFDIKETVEEMLNAGNLDLIIQTQFDLQGHKIALAATPSDLRARILTLPAFEKIDFQAFGSCHTISYSAIINPKGEK